MAERNGRATGYESTILCPTERNKADNDESWFKQYSVSCLVPRICGRQQPLTIIEGRCHTTPDSHSGPCNEKKDTNRIGASHREHHQPLQIAAFASRQKYGLLMKSTYSTCPLKNSILKKSIQNSKRWILSPFLDALDSQR